MGFVAIEGPPGCCNIVQVGYGTCYGRISGLCEKDNPALQRDLYAYGRDPNSPGCNGFTKLEPTGHWFNVWSAGNDYSVEEDAAGKFVVRSLNASANVLTTTICWTNEFVTVFGESWDIGDAIGGSNAAHLVFSLERFKTTPNEAWRVLPSICNKELGNIWYCEVFNSNSVHLWTSR